jgi:hypothetical protein
MRVVSTCIPQYLKLSKSEKIEWDNRLVIFITCGLLQICASERILGVVLGMITISDGDAEFIYVFYNE